MNRQPIITAIESDNDGYLVITVKGKSADKIAEAIRNALWNEMNKPSNKELAEALEFLYGAV